MSVIRFPVWLALVAASVLFGSPHGGFALQTTIQIDATPQTGTTVACRTQLEFRGQVVLLAQDDSPAKNLPLAVDSVQTFDQVTIDDRITLRKYSEASANISIDGQKTTSELVESNHQIAIRLQPNEFRRPLQYFSTGGALKQAEKELLTIPADLIGLRRLLETKPISAGVEWTPTNERVQTLLSLDNVIDNQVQLMVKSVDDQNTAKIYLSGDVLGEVDGAQTRVKLLGIVLYDLNQQTITAFRATFNEDRQPSQLAPGFVGTVKIDARCKRKENKVLTEDAVQQVASQLNAKQNTRLLWNSDSEFELLYDPQWRVILSDPEVVIMRYAQKGNLLAQCNVLRLPKRPAERPLKMAEFQVQLEKTVLGESGAKISRTRELTTESGLRALQVVVSGVQESVPIHWIYYHLSNQAGQCVAVVVTIEDELMPAFGQADLRLLESIRFTTGETKQAQRSTTSQKK